MMNRWLLFFSCAILGLVMLLCGLLVPIHLRAVDASVLQSAGRKSPTLVDQGLTFAGQYKLGSAQLLFHAAQNQSLPNREKLGSAIANLTTLQPNLAVWGASEPRLENLLRAGPASFTETILRLDNREKALQFLQASPRPSVQELLRCRSLTNTVIFPASTSSAGQAFDAALTICGLLLEQGQMNKGLSDTILAEASAANSGQSPQPLEQNLMDLMSLGQRFNWGQFASFVGPISDAETLHLLANQVRNANSQLPTLFSAVQLSGNPADVAKYLLNFGQTGLQDLGASLRFNANGVKELLKRDQRLYNSNPLHRLVEYDPFASFFYFAADYCWLMPTFSLVMKWCFYLCGGFLLAIAVHFLKPVPSGLEKPLHVRGIHVAREILFALGFLLVIILLTEPFLSQESQKAAPPFKLHLPTVGSVAAAVKTHAYTPIMNPTSLLTLLLFFVLQGLIYVACLVKLAEIRRQQVPPRTKLKLLENEEHLFDAGLYLGFAGTIVSLILVSLGISKFSLMAAYSSTSFGIVFVSIFKIFHLRHARRTLLLEAEATQVEPVRQTATPSLVVPS
ncbi:hypothetical protein [Pedosphaera parvula]|uniref:Uncharacterized protein n=1 Tax=Pedosphaera parvula (strain Ellin514) TaxID=320771 RepID=B9XK15_PEDPL|nr:hypothetical protein [Pedosphaera parvula]EEF59838.1 conserved hypothetical protein [Pedosphaera parvula Ellin514]